MDTDTNKPSILRYLIIAVLIYVISIVLSVLTRTALSVDSRFFVLNDSQAGAVAAMVQGVVVAIAAGFTLYQLRVGDNYDKRKSDIEEAQFILDYNQAFIESDAMYDVEHRLEMWMEAFYEKLKTVTDMTHFELERLKESIPLEITDMNRQKYINYLVYLEGLAPLIIKKVLRLETIDDLFAYRFYLAINNPILQDDQIKKYSEYFCGCFRVYDMWTKHRVFNNRPILLEDFSIDKWERFPYYSNSDIAIRKLTINPINGENNVSWLSSTRFVPNILQRGLFQKYDKLETVAELIYETDEYIYPVAFKSKRNAKRILSEIIKKKEGLFSFKNIRVAVDEHRKNIVGIVVVTEKSFSIDVDDNIKNKLPESFQDVYKRCFEKLSSTYEGLADVVYIACVCVNKNYRNRKIGGMLLTQIVNEYEKKDIYLDVLAYNKNAIRLYDKFGFAVVSEHDGYSYRVNAPRVYTMMRRKSV